MYSDIDASYYLSNAHYFESTNALVLAGGVGAEFMFTDRLAAQVDYINYNDHDGDYSHLPLPASHLVSIGLNYLF